MKYDVVIVGAGASGLVAAYKLSNCKPQLNIALVEKESVPGRKLKASGNGKCNLTNRFFDESCYESNDREFIKSFVSKHDISTIIELFGEMGILLYEQKGYFYPISNQAGQVTGLLTMRCKNNGVHLFTGHQVTDIHQTKDGMYEIRTQTNESERITFRGTYVIFATGGCAAPQLGGCSSGFNIVKKMGHKCYQQTPALCPIYILDDDLTIAKGVRLDVEASIRNKKGEIKKEAGQVQFNKDNLSGIVIMNLSGSFYKWYKEGLNDSLTLDVLPSMKWDELKLFFENQQSIYENETILSCLLGLFPKPFASYLLIKCKINENTGMQSMREKDINKLTSSIKKLVLKGIYKEDFDKSQVTDGGVFLSEINPDTYESIQYHNFFMTGELLDIYGKCGGYNLSFAIFSALDAVDCILQRIDR